MPGTGDFHPVANIWPMMSADDLQDLADDIKTNGLHYAIWRHRDGRIIDGRNRWLACDLAGVECPSNIYGGPDGPALVSFVVSMNEKRRHMDESQRSMVAARIANLNRGDNQHTAIAATSQSEAAKLLNVSADSVQRARTVQERGTPELVDAVEKGRVAVSAAAHIARAPAERQRTILATDEKAIKQAAAELAQERARENAAKRAEVAARQAAMPTAGYRTVVIDPPWPMQKIERDVRPNQVGFDYPTMSEDELRELRIPADQDCHLFLWTTHKFLPMAYRLLEAWGFRYVCAFVWHKPGGFQPIGLPQYNCEFALYARRGSPVFTDTKSFFCCFQAPRREHSRKPDEFYDVIRRVTPGPRIDIFSREARDGFDQFGNEADKFQGAA